MDGFEQTKEISRTMSAVQFQMPLKPGRTRLQTWLIDDQGNSRGAYYAAIERIQP